MTSSKGIPLNRRNFMVQTGAATAIAIGASSALKAQTTSRVSAGTKPPLTQRSIDTLLSVRPEQRAALAAEVRRDLKTFVRNRFTLGETQAKMLDSMSPKQLEMINRQLDVAEASGGNFSARLIGPNTGPDVPPPARKCEGLEISITFTF